MSHQVTTKAIRVGQHQNLSDTHCEPIAMTGAYIFTSAKDAALKFSGAINGNVYSRFSNPTVRAFEQRVAAMEETEDAVAFASGMAAIVALAHAWLRAGQNIVCSRDVFGTTLRAFCYYFGKLGIAVRIVNLIDINEWASAIDDNTSFVFMETPSNPLQNVGDISQVARLAHARGAKLVVDNTLLTPVQQKPLRFDADVVMHSAGKYMDGHERCVAGVLVGSEHLMHDIRAVLRATGTSLGAMDSWLLLKSLETLQLRVNAISENAMQLAEWLQKHPAVKKVVYSGLASHPQRELACHQQSGFGGVLSFEVGNCQGDAWGVVDSLTLISRATSIGDTRTMITHPASTTHGKLSSEELNMAGIGQNLLRLSVGLENVGDLMEDLAGAMLAVREQ